MNHDPTIEEQPDPVFLKTVPHAPGVYLMHAADDRVLYVGKALDLKKRLASYRRTEARQYAKTAVMLRKTRRIETILTGTEKEALILEASLIKKYRPRYNVILRDDKNYPYLKVTIGEDWPRILVARRRVADGSRYFGPFASASAMRDTLRLVREIFPIRTCKGRKLKKLERPCLNSQMGRCPAPCCGLADRDLYLAAVDNMLQLLNGNWRRIADELRTDMNRAAARLDFEEAAFLRDRLASLQKTMEKQVVAADHRRDQDVFALVRQGMEAVVSVLTVRAGMVIGHQAFSINARISGDEEIMGATLGQYYSDDRPVPGEVFLSCPPEDLDLLEETLSELAGKKVRIRMPRRGNVRQLVRMARENARQVLAARRKKERAGLRLLEAMRDSLRLKTLPRRIECLDISNIGGRQAVGSLVCFEQGEPLKKRYRHYKIRGEERPDDYGMMREVIRRRLAGETAENELPDLFLVDGGKGQLNIALAVFKEFGRAGAVELAGIAKEKKDEGEKLYRPGRKNPIILSGHSPVLLLLMRIRDESHRFGITLHRRLRRSATLRSDLDAVPGIGPVKRRALLKRFGSVKGIKSADQEELAKVPGISSALARDILEVLSADQPELPGGTGITNGVVSSG